MAISGGSNGSGFLSQGHAQSSAWASTLRISGHVFMVAHVEDLYMHPMPTAGEIATRQLLLSFPDCPAFVPFPAACKFIGIARQTGDHWLSQNKFPLPTVRIGTRKLGVPLAGLQMWLEAALEGAGIGQAATTKAPEACNSVQATLGYPPAKRGRGRPRKTENKGV